MPCNPWVRAKTVSFFLSDGESNSGGSFTDEVATLIDPLGLNAQIRAIGLGTDIDYSQLDLVDDGIANNSAEQVLTPSELTSGLTGSPVADTEIASLSIKVNGVEEVVLLPQNFTITPLGLQYSVQLDTLQLGAADVVTVDLVASDSLMTTASVSLTVADAPTEEGDDTLIGGDGFDILRGDGGNDLLLGGADNDSLDGGRGNDILIGESGMDTLLGGSGDDSLFGNEGDDLIIGGEGNDVLTGGTGEDALEGGGGNDLLIGGSGDDDINGGAGFDTVFYGNSSAGVAVNLSSNAGAGGNADGDVFADVESVTGSVFSDTLTGNAQANTLVGGGGNDVLTGLEGGDVLSGGAGSDTASYLLSDATVAVNLTNLAGAGGHASGDVLVNVENVTGSAFGDLLVGDAMDNVLAGASGGDLILGLDGDDTIAGGDGGDVMTGGAGNDSFVFTQSIPQDIILDFDQNGDDRLVFSGFGPGLDFADVQIFNVNDTTNDGIDNGDAFVIATGWQGGVVLKNAFTLVDAGDFVFV